jgi:tetratricopeptide (TPR) repeat protein
LVRVGERAVFVDVASATVHTLYGIALGKVGQRDKAVFELESALLCKPEPKDAAAIYVEMAKMLKASGKPDKAKAAAAEALRLDPGHKEAGPLAQ